ncbi:hypothetical protein BJ741DRAFT_612274 [Chytriomyces cf. hyalinus JEL632]|nr:hypothetical protein BJ741DRAFT_612274 [Chytriomyces cf. hyalinus JEL632]
MRFLFLEMKRGAWGFHRLLLACLIQPGDGTCRGAVDTMTRHRRSSTRDGLCCGGHRVLRFENLARQFLKLMTSNQNVLISQY